MSAAEKAELAALLQRVRHYEMTPEEIREQSIGWVVGNSPEGLRQTREEVRATLRPSC